MKPEISIRPGTIDDIDFIIACIIEAERAGTQISSYEKIFSISEEELRKILKDILSEEIPGREMCCDNYFLAFDRNLPVGGVGAWIEGSGTQGSNTVRANMFSYFLGPEKWKNSQQNLKLVSQYEIPRVPGTLQFEDAYVVPGYRGYRVIEKVFAHGIREFAKKNPAMKLVQGFTLAGNIQSLISMMKMKWKQSRKVMFDNGDLLNLLPGKGKIQWELDLNDPKIITEYSL